MQVSVLSLDLVATGKSLKPYLILNSPKAAPEACVLVVCLGSDFKRQK